MHIDILCNDGSPLGITAKDVYGEGKRGIGIGGAELALITMCEAWQKAGHRVFLYNDPFERKASSFEQRFINDFDPSTDRDVLIVFRSPNEKSIGAKGFKVWWSCDQYTVGDFKEFAPTVHKIVGISDFHRRHFIKEYGINTMEVIDLPVRVDEYKQDIQKVPGRCIFTSVPDRGLNILHAAWPLINRDYPESSLVITSDYRLWGAPDALNQQHRMMWINHVMDMNVTFKGAIPRRELVQEELKAQVLAYPSIYDELFCIACAEAQVAGAYAVTSRYGALPTTNGHKLIEGEPTNPLFVERFVDAVITALQTYDEKKDEMRFLREMAKFRFDPKRIVEEWDKKIFCGV